MSSGFDRLMRMGLAWILAGCGLVETPEDSRRSRIDRLRALPYIGFTEKTVPEDERGTVTLDTGRSQPGYNFYTIRNLSRADLFNQEGALVRSWQGPRGRWARASLQPNGDVLIAGMDARRYVMRMNWDGKVLWRYDLEAHHDIGRTPDGRVMVLTFQERWLPRISDRFAVRDDLVTILNEEGKVEDSASLFNMMSKSGFQFERVAPDEREGHIDLFHANSVQWMTQDHLYQRHPIYGPGNILVSIRHQNTVAVFDWEKRELLWEWGRGQISGQHDAQVLKDGHFLIFDNGLSRGWSRVIELDPLSKRIVWEYSAPDQKAFYTLGRGSNQRLKNGNTLITESDSGRVFEVTREGDIVWDFFAPYIRKKRRATLTRCYRYDTDFVERLIRQN